MEIPKLMKEKYAQAKELIEKSSDIKIYSHIDCDGICSGAILSTILDRLNKPHDIDFVNLDVLDNLKLDHELTIFSDLGSGQSIDMHAKEGQKIIVLDHHPPLRDIDYGKNKDYTYLEINPNHYGIDGSYYVCGGGLCYFLSKEFGYKDLSWIGVLSAIGDMQNNKTGHFEGLNKIIQEDAINEGYLELEKNDLNIYGRNTRELFIALSYFSDVTLPITNNQNETKALLDELAIDSTITNITPEEKDVLEKIGIICKDNTHTFSRQDRGILNRELDSIRKAQTLPIYLNKDEFMILNSISQRIKRKTLSELTNVEKGKLYNSLNRMIANAVPGKYVKYIPSILIGDSYTFLLEDPASFLRDGAEFSTAMNACGRNKEEKIAMEVLKGDRQWALIELENISRTHRYNLATSMEKVTSKGNIKELENFQYFDGDGIKPEIVGTITGMILGYCNWKKPIIGFTQIENSDGLKVSLRCSRFLSYDGIHFGNIIREVSSAIGGTGGGHSMACGAYIPINKKSEFLNKFNKALEGKIDN